MAARKAGSEPPREAGGCQGSPETRPAAAAPRALLAADPPDHSAITATHARRRRASSRDTNGAGRRNSSFGREGRGGERAHLARAAARSASRSPAGPSGSLISRVCLLPGGAAVVTNCSRLPRLFFVAYYGLAAGGCRGVACEMRGRAPSRSAAATARRKASAGQSLTPSTWPPRPGLARQSSAAACRAAAGDLAAQHPARSRAGQGDAFGDRDQ